MRLAIVSDDGIERENYSPALRVVSPYKNN
ncbi:hypothetical protein BsWGS_28892 [Bradybaena similaris]